METKRIGAGVGVVLERDGKILLGMRNPEVEKPESPFKSAGYWTLPGGKLEWGETFEDASVRETIQETAIRINNPVVISVHNSKNDRAHFVTVGLTAASWEGEAQVMEPEEIVEWRWFDRNDLPEKLYFPSSQVIAAYRQGKFYIKES